jgi:hypothetical protein
LAGYSGIDAGGDGIGETCIINEYNTDPYPPIKPYDITTAASQMQL